MNYDNSLIDLKAQLGLVKKLSKRYHKYADILAKGFVTKQEIVNLKSILNGHGLTGNLTKLEVSKLTDLHEYMFKCPNIIRIESDHTQQGLKFLTSLYKTPTGKTKKNIKLEDLKIPDSDVEICNENLIELIEDFKEFRYGGFLPGEYNAYRNQYIYSPVWEVVSNKGLSFAYVQQFSGFWRQ